MGATTGIPWTDSTVNFWWGCTKVGPACDDCYAEATDKRAGGSHWGHGVPRRKIKGAPALLRRLDNGYADWAADSICRRENAKVFGLPIPLEGIRRRVFIQSMSDLFDLEVELEWFDEAWRNIVACNRLAIQICTKRVSAIEKRLNAISFRGWPQHVGVLITVVTQAEADRDIPRLLELKRRFGIPWVGISYEPAQEYVSFWPYITGLDWIIFGGKSGRNWNDRPFDLDWARRTRAACEISATAFFMKQVAAFRPTDAMIPADLMVRQFPPALP